MIVLPASLFLWLPRWGILGVFSILVGSGLILWLVPCWQIQEIRSEGIDRKALAELEDGYRRTLTQIIGGIAVLISIYFTWNNLIIGQRTLEQSERRATAKMFSKATEQLSASLPDGSPRLESRLGGIYTLNQISKTDFEYWRPIINLFNAYLRANSHLDNSQPNTITNPREDIVAVFELFGMEPNLFSPEYERGENIVRSLPDIDVPGLSLRGYRLRRVSYSNAILTDADFSYSDFSNVSFAYTNLRSAKFENVVVKGLSFDYSNLKNASFRRAKLEGTSFSQTSLSGADFEGADLNSTIF